MQKDLYDVLGVSKDSDQDTIKKAFRKLAMQLHPDKNPGDKEAEEKFKEAAAAYEVLGTPEKRARYDRFGHAGVGGGGFGGGQGFQNVEDIFESFSDIFGDFFGMGGNQRKRGQGPRRGADLRYMCELSLKDVLNGLNKDLEFDTEDACGTCEGSGVEKGHSLETCPRCKGAGQVIASQGFFQVATPCPNCQGQGQLNRHPCTTCKGRGRQRAHRKIKVTIPPGVDTGTRLRVSNEGEGGYKGGPKGDLFVEIRVLEDDNFVRQGADIYSRVSISYIQALLGGEVSVETLEGAQTLEVPHGTATGTQLRLSGKGVPFLKSKGRGDLIYQCEVTIPKKLKKEEEKLLREIAKIRDEEPPKGKGFLGF